LVVIQNNGNPDGIGTTGGMRDGNTGEWCPFHFCSGTGGGEWDSDQAFHGGDGVLVVGVGAYFCGFSHGA